METLSGFAVFVENERWFFDFLERALSFFSLDNCREVFTAADHTYIFAPVDALQQGIAALLEQLQHVRTHAEFFAALAGSIPLLTDVVVGFCDQYPRAASAVERSSRCGSTQYDDLMLACKRSGEKMPSTLTMLLQMCLDHIFSYGERIAEAAENLPPQSPAHVAAQDLVAQLSDVQTQARAALERSRMQMAAFQLTQRLRVPQERDFQGLRLPALLNKELVRQFTLTRLHRTLLGGSKPADPVRASVFEDTLLLTEIKSSTEELLLCLPLPLAQLFFKEQSDGTFELWAKKGETFHFESTHFSHKFELSGLIRAAGGQVDGCETSRRASRTSEAAAAPDGKRASSSFALFRRTSTARVLQPSPADNTAQSPPAAALAARASQVSLAAECSKRFSMLSSRSSATGIKPAPAGGVTAGATAGTVAGGSGGVHSPPAAVVRSPSRASLLPVDKQVDLVIETMNTSRRWADGMEELLDDQRRVSREKFYGQKSGSLRTLFNSVRIAEEEAQHLAESFQSLPAPSQVAEQRKMKYGMGLEEGDEEREGSCEAAATAAQGVAGGKENGGVCAAAAAATSPVRHPPSAGSRTSLQSGPASPNARRRISVEAWVGASSEAD